MEKLGKLLTVLLLLGSSMLVCYASATVFGLPGAAAGGMLIGLAWFVSMAVVLR